MKNLFAAFLIAISVVVAAGQKVQVGADRTVNLAKYKTYSWASGGAANPLINQMIVNAVDREMALKGLTKVELNGDINVVVWAATESDLHISYPSWHPSMNSIATGVVSGSQQWPVTKGTLVVDMLDANTKNSVWRGQATDTLDHGPTGNMQKDAKSVEKKIKKAVEKMFKKFPVAT
ncbi:MAG TPA: DUF4136 domain-containing protein [Pyrinomonadaceae bacterium]|nr:DUF4136 domain-containing protein [Pyrinomonadaceae bacterium]